MQGKRAALACTAFVAAALGAVAEPAAEPAASLCGRQGLALQVLGSGGPELAGRASAGYLIWHDGKAKVLVDLGAGSALRFREAGAKLADLEMILLTHLHADHSADLPALIKSALFERRRAPLPLLGPSAGGQFPSTTEFAKRLVDAKAGAFAYLSDYLEPGIFKGYELAARDVAPGAAELELAHTTKSASASAAAVVHADIPALAWRVGVAGKRIVFSGDGNGRNGNLEKLAADADLLVAHLAVPEGTHGGELDYHMPPSAIGRIAAAARAKQLVLGHRMTRTLGKEEETRAEIAKAYEGPVVFADDLGCVPVK